MHIQTPFELRDPLAEGSYMLVDVDLHVLLHVVMH